MRDCVTNLRAVVMGAALLAGHCVRIEPAPQQQAASAGSSSAASSGASTSSGPSAASSNNSNVGAAGASCPPGLNCAATGAQGDFDGGVAFGSSPPGRPVDPALMPQLGPTVTATTPPPPISGGTLITLSDGVTAVAADPDRDAVYVVSIKAAAVTYTITLQPGDEPGRLVEDGEGRVHVALRKGGALVTINPLLGTILQRRLACPAPRGVAWDASTDQVWVACATGELVSLPASGGAISQKVTIERDLRDVLIDDGSLSVTEFRSAQVLRLGSGGSITRRDSFPAPDPTVVPQVVWRAVEGPSHTLVAVHQEHSVANVSTKIPGGYGLQSVVTGQCTMMGPDGTPVESVAVPVVLPVDIAVSPDASFAAIVGAGDALAQGLNSIAFVSLADANNASSVDPTGFDDDAGAFGGAVPPGPVPSPTANFPAVSPGVRLPIGSQATAVAFDNLGDVLVQTREPAALWVIPVPAGGSQDPPWGVSSGAIALSSASRDDTGHDIFHASAGALIACASCHPEGGDDGHIWMLDGEQRRTPSLRGTIAGTAPYHWPGDQADFPTLTVNVYTGRMSGAALGSDQVGALQGWVEAIPAPPAPSWIDVASASRGEVLFQRADTRCSGCHSGAKLTNNQTVDVGTGQAFQVPPLVGVGWRTPLLHNGCAATIADRFSSCATVGHGDISALSSQDVADLTEYLEGL
jgi:hypothetical protein